MRPIYCRLVFVDAIGLAGTMTSYSVGKNAFTTEAPEFLERFLQALSQTTKIDIAIINDLKVTYSHFLFTFNIYSQCLL